MSQIQYNAALDAVYIYVATDARSDHCAPIDDDGRIIVDYDKNNNMIGLMIDYISDQPELAYNVLLEKKSEISIELYNAADSYLRERLMINILEK